MADVVADHPTLRPGDSGINDRFAVATGQSISIPNARVQECDRFSSGQDARDQVPGPFSRYNEAPVELASCVLVRRKIQ